MARCELSAGQDLLPTLLIGQDGLAKLVKAVANQILEAGERSVGRAERHERKVAVTGARWRR
jgi:hypothetical protein